MSVPGGPDAAAEPGEYRVPGRLLEKLMAVVRPEFRADVLAFDAADPVFGSPAWWWADAAARPAAGDCASAMKDAGGAAAGRRWRSSPPPRQRSSPSPPCCTSGCPAAVTGSLP